MDSDSETELSKKLTLFFTGLEAGLKSLREVRSAFDEEVAFDFNPLIFFSINENTVSDMLAYFLNPEAEHGQQDKLLKVFLQHVLDEKELKWIESQIPPLPIKVDTQFFTDNRRPIDTVITFGKNEFIIGIENKVWYAVDQEKQIHDYISDIKTKSRDNFLMLYLSPRGETPSANSIAPEVLKEYKDNDQFKIIPFCSAENKVSVLSILKAMADAARADPVRAFLKFLEKYLKFHFLGEKTMDESTFLVNYLTQHSESASQVPALAAAYATIKNDVQQTVYEMINSQLKESPSKISPSATLPNNVKFTYEGKQLPRSLAVCFEYPDIGLPLSEYQKFENNIQNNNINKDNLEKFVIAMRSIYSNLKTTDWWLGGFVGLPNYIVDDKLLTCILEEKAQSFSESIVLKRFALNVSDFIVKYIYNVEMEWQKAGLPLAMEG